MRGRARDMHLRRRLDGRRLRRVHQRDVSVEPARAVCCSGAVTAAAAAAAVVVVAVLLLSNC